MRILFLITFCFVFLIMPFSLSADIVLDIEMQYRIVTSLDIFGDADEALANFPNPFCMLFGVQFMLINEYSFFLYPELGVILGGSSYTMETPTESISLGAFGGGAFLRFLIGIADSNGFHFLVKPELSYLYLKGQDSIWTMFEFGSGIGGGFFIDQFHLFFEIIRFGVRPGAAKVLFLALYPSFGLGITL